MSEPGPDPVRRMFGLLLMTVGGLIAGLSGLCTMVWVGSSLADATADSLLYAFGLALVIGGIPIFVGGLLTWWGWRLYRVRRKVRRANLAMFSDDAGGPPDPPS